MMMSAAAMTAAPAISFASKCSPSTPCPSRTAGTGTSSVTSMTFAGPDRATTTSIIADVLVAEGEDADVAACVATQFAVRADQRLVIEQLLGIESSHVVALRSIIERGCAGG